MATAIQGLIGQSQATRWLPWVLGATLLLYFIGYVDGTVHAAALGSESVALQYVHEFFHHGRHLILMCH